MQPGRPRRLCRHRRARQRPVTATSPARAAASCSPASACPTAPSPPPTSSSDGRARRPAKSPSYTAALNAAFPPPPGFRWEGYLSTRRSRSIPRTAGDRSTLLAAGVRAPAGRQRRAVRQPVPLARVIGLRARPAQGAANPNDPVSLQPRRTRLLRLAVERASRTTSVTVVTDLGVLTGSSVTVAPGRDRHRVLPDPEPATPATSAAAPSRCRRSTTVPGAAATPATASLTVAANADSLDHGERRRCRPPHPPGPTTSC